MIKYLSFLIAIVFLYCGCKKETELKKTVFVSDPENSNLPLYSEWGYNTFGAYYDRAAFVSNDNEVAAKVMVTQNKTSFVLTGQKGSGSYYYNASNKMSITFRLSGFLPEDYRHLVTLNDTTLDLKNPGYSVVITEDTIDYQAAILNGTLQIKRAQNLFVDTKQVEVILSGYFEFQALLKNKPVTISDGRFDVGIGSDNFYRY